MDTESGRCNNQRTDCVSHGNFIIKAIDRIVARIGLTHLSSLSLLHAYVLLFLYLDSYDKIVMILISYLAHHNYYTMLKVVNLGIILRLH